MKKFVSSLAFIIVVSMMSYAEAVVIYEDDFNSNSNQVTEEAAYYDQDKTLYRLPKKQMPNAIQLLEYGNEYAVINGDSIEFYQFDEGTNQMQAFLDIPYTNPLGMAVRQDQRSMWVFDDSQILRYEFAGDSMIRNPALDILGMDSIVAVSSMPYEDTVFVLEDDGMVKRFHMDAAGAMILADGIATGITDPISITTTTGYDFVVSGRSGTEYFAFSGSGYVKNPALSVLGFENVIAHTQDGGKLTVVDQDEIRRYLFTGTEMVYSNLLSVGEVKHAISLSSKTDSYDVAVVDEEGMVRYWQFDGEQMIENPSLSVTGLNINGGYLQPKQYRSPIIPTAKQYNLVYLETTEDNDPNSLINYEISSDGGTTWIDIVPESWTDMELGNSFVVRAMFVNTNKDATPRLLSIRLEATKMDIYDLAVTDIVLPPAEQGTDYPITSFPVLVNLGAEFTFQIQTEGYIETLTAKLSNGDSIILEPQQSTSEEFNVWIGKYVPSLGEEKDKTVQVEFVGIFEGREIKKDFGDFYTTNNLVALEAGIRLVK